MNGRLVKITKYNKNNNFNIVNLIITAIMAVGGIIMVLPFLWMISTSMKYEVDVFNFPIDWIPRQFRVLENYRQVWIGEVPFSLYYFNSIKVTVITTVVALLMASLAAYAFARMDFPGKDKLFILYIATMIIPDQVTLLPRFLYFKWLGLFNTHISLVFGGMFSITSIFLLRQFMIALPQELTDSARIDGAGHLRIYWNIITPLTKPALATLAILKFIWTWNDYQNPLIFLTDPKLFTIQLGIKMFSDRYGAFYSLIMAAAVSAIIPLFIVFFIGQKYIIEGITAGSVKG